MIGPDLDREAAKESRLLLVRHAAAVTSNEPGGVRLIGSTDVELSDRGRAQAEHLAQALAPELAGSRIISSPLSRALATARTVAQAADCSIELREDLREIDCGLLDGCAIDEIRAAHPALWAANLRQDDDDFRWPGGESYREFRARCLAALSDVLYRYPGHTIVVVTHAGVISQLLGSHYGNRPAAWEPHRPGETGITELLCGSTGCSLVRFDDRSHLPQALRART